MEFFIKDDYIFLILPTIAMIYLISGIFDDNEDPILNQKRSMCIDRPDAVGRVVRIGHRGAAGYVDENTLESFSKALELEVDMIEFDIHQTADGRFVVIHDKELDRTINATGLVANKTWSEISKYRTKHNHSIPLLEEVLDFIGSACIDNQKKNIMVNIEIKTINCDINPAREDNGIAKLAKIINNYLQKGWQSNQFVISSFDHYIISEFKNYHPNIHTSALLEGLPIGLAKFGIQANANSIGISQDFVNKTFIDDAHRRGLLVFVYTPNTKHDINRVLAMGADGIFSNYPDLIPFVVMN
jgi:glycerophosphoryl diester phosphodiesterase